MTIKSRSRSPVIRYAKSPSNLSGKERPSAGTTMTTHQIQAGVTYLDGTNTLTEQRLSRESTFRRPISIEVRNRKDKAESMLGEQRTQSKNKIVVKDAALKKSARKQARIDALLGELERLMNGGTSPSRSTFDHQSAKMSSKLEASEQSPSQKPTPMFSAHVTR